MTSLQLQLRGWRLTTAEILYYLPDHPSLLQSYLWQNLDRAPDFPSLRRFLAFWQESLEGKLHSVRIASRQIVAPAEIKTASLVGHIH